MQQYVNISAIFGRETVQAVSAYRIVNVGLISIVYVTEMMMLILRDT